MDADLETKRENIGCTGNPITIIQPIASYEYYFSGCDAV
jgi:hypothetical protein